MQVNEVSTQKNRRARIPVAFGGTFINIRAIMACAFEPRLALTNVRSVGQMATSPVLVTPN